jgi:protoporphyrinogen oxidase
MENIKTDVVILGAGVAGLACGHELTKKSDKKSVLVDKNPYVGGLAVTMRKDGFAFDSGPHRWFTKSDEIHQWMLDLMKDELVDVNRLTRIYYKGRYYNYPLKPFNALKNLGVFNAAWAMLSYLRVKIELILGLREKEGKSMKDAYINQFGYKLYNEFFNHYNVKHWGRKTDELDGDWIRQRSKGLSIWAAVKDSIIKSKNIISLIDNFKYPKKGFGRIAEKMEEQILENPENKILLSKDVVKLNCEEQNGVRKILSIEVNDTKIADIHDGEVSISGKDLKKPTEQLNTTTELQGEYYVSSMPITELVLRMSPSAPEEVVKAARGLSFRDYVQVTLMVNKAHFTPDNWVYTQDQRLIFVRLMEMDSWTDGLSPDGTTSIVFELPCQEGDERWNMKDEDVVNMVAENYINEFHYFEKENIVGSYVHRIPKEYPVYDLGYKEKVATLKDFLKTVTNLQIIGRNGTFKYNNSDHSIQMGLYAARNILGGSYDLENINTDRAYQEIKKVEKPSN